jgi:hypothetical protein
MKENKAIQTLNQIDERLNVIKGTVDLVLHNSTDDDVVCPLDLVSAELQRVINFVSTMRTEISKED